MMVSLFLLFFISLVLILFGMRKTALVLSVITLILCVCMFLQHATTKLPIHL